MDYDPIAKSFEQYGKDAITDWVLGLNIVAQFLQPIENKNILDYGCGAGRFSRFLNDQGAHVIGVDVSREMIRMAKEQSSSGIEYRHIFSGDLSSLGLNSYDAAVANFVLCTVGAKDEMERIFSEFYGIIKPKGLLVILNVNWETFNGHEAISTKLDSIDSLISGTKVGGVLKGENPIRIEDYFWSRKDYVSFFQRAGFKNIVIEETIAKDDDHPWIDEKKYSPLFIVKGEK